MTKMMLGFNFDDIVMAWVADGQEALCGKSVHQIAREWKTSDLDAYLRLVDLSGGKGRVLMRKYLTPDILSRLMDDPCCLCMTDAWVEEQGVQNAAAFGCFPEFLRLAAKQGTLEKTVRQMTGATADRFGINGRGYLKEGYIADITVFDHRQVRPSEQPDANDTASSGCSEPGRKYRSRVEGQAKKFCLMILYCTQSIYQMGY